MKKNTKKRKKPDLGFLSKVMRIHLILFLVGIMTSSLFAKNVFAQTTISVNLKNVSLKTFFSEVENNTDYVILYKSNIPIHTKVSISSKDEKIEEVLNSILTPLGLAYRVNGTQIIIVEAKKENLREEQSQPKKEVHGKVVDQNGEPLVGVSVVIKGTTKGLVTDLDGDFRVKELSESDILVFSFIGFVTAEIPVKGMTVINVTLLESEDALSEVVIVGFGKQKKESVVGAVQTIKPKELKTPSSSLTSSFAGRLAGVVSVQRSGEPGSDAASFWIRGISTFSGPTEPLIYIDGVEVTARDLNALSPEVIENFSVLKDATATALYGARGANGVMLVTTRKGKNMEKAVIHVRLENSITQPTQVVKLADGVDYMVAYNDAILNRNAYSTAKFSTEKILGTIKGLDPTIYPNVDWQDVLFNDLASSQSASLNVTGGGKKVNYFLNATFSNDNGMLKKDPNNKFDNQINQFRTSLQANIEAFLTKTTRVELRLNTNIIKYNGSAATTNFIYRDIFTAPPVMFQPYYPNTLNEDHILFGNNSGGPINLGEVGVYSNPYARMVSGYRTQFNSTTTASFNVQQDLDFWVKGLSAKALVSFKNYSLTNNYRSFSPYYYEVKDYSQRPDGGFDYNLKSLNRGTTALGSGMDGSGDRLINMQASLEYAHTFDKHDIGALLVYLQRDYNLNVPSSYYEALPLRNQGIAGRITYAFDGKYLAEANFGYNGSENFQKGKRMGFFPSVAVGYMISSEDYFKPLENVISSLKIRGSYGLVGNSISAGRFPYLTFIDLNGSGFTFGDNFQTSKYGAMITRYGADGAEWESGIKVNLGLDMTLFRDLGITVDVYREKRKNIFMQRNLLPAEIGISFNQRPFANLGVVKNQGIDISLDYNKALSKDLTLSLRGSFTYSANELLERDELPREFDYQSDLGKPLNVIRGLRAIGLFKDQADIDSSPEQTYMAQSLLKPGDIKYADLNNDGIIDNNDRELLGDPFIPQITYGFGGSLSYRKFDFSIFFQGVAKTSIVMSNIHPFTTNETVLFDFIAEDYWTERNPNPDAAYPRLISGTVSHNNNELSSYWLRDGSFLRLKNLELGYSYKFARIYLAGQNLLTFSPFKHWDPELGGAGVNSGNGYQGNGLWYPPLRMYNIGLQLTF